MQKLSRSLAIVVVLAAAGCSANYYRIQDAQTGKVFYERFAMPQRKALTNPATGEVTVTDEFSMKRITREEWEQGQAEAKSSAR